MDSKSLIDAQIGHNLQTRSAWESFASHRSHVTSLIQSQSRGESSNDQTLCILGVGNGNDIDLVSIANRFKTVTLVDLDAESVEYCLSRYPQLDNVEVIAPIDVTGALEQISDNSLSAEVEWSGEFLTSLRDVNLPELSTYDVVASTCLLSQLTYSVEQTLTDAKKKFDAILALRDGHLRLLSRLTKAGGTILLISDFVSSDTLPEIEMVPIHQLYEVVARAIEQQNFFTGLNPAVLIDRLSPSNNPDIESIDALPPWLWSLGPRSYSVVGIVARKRREGN